MSGVRVLVGTRKGAFVLASDARRERWDVSGPHFGGWEIYHLKGSPADGVPGTHQWYDGTLSGAARHDPRSRHPAAPAVREVLRLRRGSVPRRAGHPAARRSGAGRRALSDRGSHVRGVDSGRRFTAEHAEIADTSMEVTDGDE
jgi:hypothetical protein